MAWNGRGELEGPLRGPSLESRLAAQASVLRISRGTSHEREQGWKIHLASGQ